MLTLGVCILPYNLCHSNTVAGNDFVASQVLSGKFEHLPCERRGIPVGQTIVDPSSLFPGVYQSGLPKNGHVLGHRRVRKPNEVNQIADALFTARKA